MKTWHFAPKDPLAVCRYTWLAVITGMMVIVIGCMGTWGYLHRSEEVQTAFKEHRYPAGFNYYYLGFETDPNALLGVDPAYSLKESFWKRINPKFGNLNHMIDSMQYYDCIHKGYGPGSADGRRELTGFAIKDPENKTIGVLYSCYDWFPVKFLDEKRIAVYYPERFGPEEVSRRY